MGGIVIVDDQQVARTGIRALLDSHHLPVSGLAEDGKEAVEKVKKLQPSVVLLYINMPRMDGILAAYERRRVAPATKIIFLSIHDRPPFVDLTRMGDGFVAKQNAGKELIPALQRLLLEV